MTPIVSVVMPAFNSEKYIQQAIDSVRRQTLNEWELIIVDDCSTDLTYDIACKIAQEETRIKIIQNVTNCGAAASRNIGFLQCSGKYIALLDSDDLWEPEKLKKQVECAEISGADIVYCSYAIVDEQGKRKSPDFIVPDNTDFHSMLKSSVISCSTALLSKEVTRNHQFPAGMYHEDLAYWLLLLKNGATAAGIPEVLAAYRITPGSRASNKIKSAVNRWKIFRKFFHLPLWESISLLIQYAYLGLLKYRKSVGKG